MGGGFRGGGMRDAWTGPALTGRQLEKHAGILALDDEQKEAAEALLEGYQDQVRQRGEAMRARMEAARENGEDFRSPEFREQMRQGMEENRAARKKLDEALFGDIQALLTPAQAEQWPAFERAARREQSVRRGLMSGERVNLFDAVEALKLEPEQRAGLDAAMSEYDVELDRALTARNAVYEDAMGRVGQAMGGGNMEEMQKMMDAGREASARVKEVNRKYARQVAEGLPTEKRAEFEVAVKRASFPEVYRTTQAEREIEAAGQIEDLTDTQKEGLAALKETFARNLQQANDRLAAGIEEEEANATVGTLMARFRGGEAEELTELRAARREANTQAAESLRKILTPEQAARLPGPEREGDRRNEEEGGQRRRMQNDRT